MSINPVNFGKVILVKAPLTDAQKIANIANGNSETKFDKQVKQIIDDTDQGIARAYSFNPSVNKSYIFSGKESYEFGKSHFTALAEENYLNTFYSKARSTKAKIRDGWEKHAQNVNKIISSAKERTIISVDYDKNGNLNSLNIVS